MFHFRHNPNLDLLKAHIFSSKIIWANMPAALVTYLSSMLPAIGRFDLGIYLTGYAVSYAFIYGSGLTQKVDQAFEVASGYYRSAFTDKMMKFPEVQSHVNAKIASAKLKFQFINKAWENFYGNFMFILQTGSFKRLGSRAFERFFLGGNTANELIADGLLGVKENVASKIPGGKQSCNALMKFLFNNFRESKKHDMTKMFE